MSDWGQIAFYYDYEKGYRGHDTQKNRGLISQTRAYPGVAGMMLYAYNGIRYFLMHNDGRRNFSRTKNNSLLQEWVSLSRAFEVFFEGGWINPGVDAVQCALEEGVLRDKELKHSLFYCEGTYGWLFMKYTGNEKDGYALKYGYFYGYGSSEYEVRDFRSIYEQVLERKPNYFEKEVAEELEKVIVFFEENAELMTAEEFWEIEQLGVDWFRNDFLEHAIY